MLSLGRAYLDNIRKNKGPFTDEESFDASGEGIGAMEKMRILLVAPYSMFNCVLNSSQSHVRYSGDLASCVCVC